MKKEFSYWRLWIIIFIVFALFFFVGSLIRGDYNNRMGELVLDTLLGPGVCSLLVFLPVAVIILIVRRSKIKGVKEEDNAS